MESDPLKPVPPIVDVRLEYEKSTQGTHRFKEAGDKPQMGTIYLRKELFGEGKPPKSIRVTVVAEE